MRYSPVLIFHIALAIVGLVSGFAALFFRKGSRLHRKSGSVFFVSMLCMSASAICLALLKTQMINAIVGALTFYLVTTGWLTVRPNKKYSEFLDIAAMVAAFGIGIIAVCLGWQALHSATGLDKDGIPAAAYFVFGSVALFASGLDALKATRGAISGAHRIARHLWRLCFALLITSVSFFNGTRSAMLPAVIRETPIHDLPTIAVVLFLIFWLSRVLFTNLYKPRIPSTRRV